MSTDFVNRDVGGKLGSAIVKCDSAGEDLADHVGYVVQLEWNPQGMMAHAAAGAVFHFGILHLITRVRKQGVIAGVIEMHVAR